MKFHLVTKRLKMHRIGIGKGDRDLGIKAALAQIIDFVFPCAPDIPLIDAQFGS